MLNVSGLCSGYGNVQIIWDASFSVNDGEVVAILGSNGAGKTTLVRTITGMIRPWKGSVVFDGDELAGKSSRAILDHKIVQVPEGRQLFTEMSVYENLEMGAGTLSGGEQQMVAVGRALIGLPKLLILDEPSLGLAPNIVDDILSVAHSMAKEQGISVILVEQDITKALRMADRGYVVENGKITLEGTSEELEKNEHVKKAYLGI